MEGKQEEPCPVAASGGFLEGFWKDLGILSTTLKEG